MPQDPQGRLAGALSNLKLASRRAGTSWMRFPVELLVFFEGCAFTFSLQGLQVQVTSEFSNMDEQRRQLPPESARLQRTRCAERRQGGHLQGSAWGP